MWIYINDLGQVVTTIPHGEIIRQGSTFTINIAFDREYFEYIIENHTGSNECKIWSIEQIASWANDYIGMQLKFKDTPIQSPSPELVMFTKVKDNENTCQLKDGNTYVVYKFRGEVSYTEDYGNHELVIRMSTAKLKGQTWLEAEEHYDYVSGVVDVYIEPTYGYTPQIAELTFTQVDLFLEAMNEKLRKKLDIEDEKVWKLQGNISIPNEQAFATVCYNSYVKEKKHRIYLYSIGETRLIGIVSEDKVLVISGQNKILPFKKDINGAFKLDTLEIYVAEPQLDNHPARKLDLDSANEEIKSMKGKLNSLIHSNISYIVDEEEE